VPFGRGGFMNGKEEKYLTTEEVHSRYKYSMQSIYNLIYKGVFRKGVHYEKPSSKKLLFRESAIEAWIREYESNYNDNADDINTNATQFEKKNVVRLKSLINI
jgi:predicted DNA-binding transcriptional regulator AlpA